ncbi:hypothetical protein [Mesorhizobium australicum]|uniref:Uncharacterized protein n=1 Tax=Mesorhizobium australicum TaxID=536018 RepID=A0A1X7NEH5_9HYPH|nr:hypothetical protein [Mesorhizobium australicum]SMH35264.1 hypothetical protein SAMN02982922_1581 [Mesorhizobium australicum]
MTRRSFASTLRGFIEVTASAISASAAVESGKQPNAHALRRLGIDPEQFSRIIRR